MLKRVEAERDTAIFDLKSLSSDKDALRERLKNSTETSIKEKAHLEEKIDELQCMLRNSDLDKKELYRQIDLLQAQIEQLESKANAQSYQLAQANQELNDQKSASTQVKILAEDSERALEEQRRQLNFKNDELNKLEQSKLRLEQKISNLLVFLIIILPETIL
jgi:centrosomal protein CEP135